MNTITSNAACSPVASELGYATTTVDIPADGTYRVWSRIQASSASDDSYYLELEHQSSSDQHCGIVVGDTSVSTSSWQWVDYRTGSTTNKIDLNLQAGTYAVKMIGREASVKVDRILFLTDSTCITANPGGTGDDCIPDTTTPPPPAPEKPDTPYLGFDGTDDYASLGGLNISSSQMTIEAWFNSSNLTNCSNDCRIVSKSSSIAEQDHDWMLSTIDSSNGTVLRARMKAGGSTTTLIANSGTLTDNTWYHAAFVYNGSNMELYLNGQLVGSTSKSGTIANSTTEARIGSNADNTRHWQGFIDDVRIWNTARSQDDIQQNYSKELTGGESGLAAYYKLNEGAGQTIIDAAGGDNNGRLGSTSNADSSDPSWQNTGATADTQSPVVDITVPTDGQTLSGSVDISANAYDDVGVDKVEFYLNQQLIGTDSSEPFTTTLDTTELPNQSWTIKAVASDAAGNQAEDSVTISTENANQEPDTTAPTVSLTSPTNGATVAGTINVAASATDDTGVEKVEFYRGNQLVSTDFAAPYTSAWDTTQVADGSYNLSAQAYDAAGNVGSSSTVTVNVENVTADTTPPTVPGDLAASAISTSQINLAWTASTDNEAVTAYDIYRDGSLIVSLPASSLSYGDTGLTASTTYNYYIIARDAAGNQSNPTATKSATTQNQPPAAETGSVQGIVTSDQNGKPLSGTAVSLSVNGNKQTFVTNSSGSYEFTNLPQDSYDVLFDAHRHALQTITVTITSNTTTTQDVLLSRNYGKPKR